MKGWRLSTWGDEIVLNYGKALRGYEKAEGVVRVYGSNGPIGWTNIALSTGPGVILGRKGAYRGIEYSKTDFFVIDTAYYVTLKNDHDLRWIYYAIQFYKLGKIDDGSPVPSTTRAAVYVRELHIPPKHIQSKIGKILGEFDDKIDLNRQVNQTLEAMARAIFKSWFVDFDPVKAKIAAKQEGHDPLRAAMSAISGKSDAELAAMPCEQYDQLAAAAKLFPDCMVESELGEIPKGWEVSKIETLLTRLTAKTKFTKLDVTESGRTPVFEQGGAIFLGYHNEKASFDATISDPLFIFGDHTCVTRLSLRPFDISQNVIPIRGSRRATTWVYHAIYGRQQFQEYRRHWVELISKTAVIAPPDICDDFAHRVSLLHFKIEQSESENMILGDLRDTLLPKLLSGELVA